MRTSDTPKTLSIWTQCRFADLPARIVEGLEERRGFLDVFAHNPSDPKLWNYVIDQTLSEEQLGHKQPTELATISALDLSSFARKIVAAKPSDRYTLTTISAPNGKLRFDVLYGFHSKSGERAIEAALKEKVERFGKFKTLIDLGSGTGNTVAAVSHLSEHATGVERNHALLLVAKQKHPNIDFAEGDVTKLPFESSTADIMISNGLKYSLDAQNAVAMYREIARILRPGGIYIDAELLPPEDIILSRDSHGLVVHPDFHPEDLGEFVTWRALLQDMVVDTTSGKFEKVDSLPLSGPEWRSFLRQLGLSERYAAASGKGAMARARILRKSMAPR